MSYNSSYTLKYKCGWIHGAVIDGNSVITFQVDSYAYIIYAKSLHAAKIAITKYFNKKGLK